MDYRYHAIILGKRDIGETDRFYIIYTLEDGKINAVGKGARKPNAKLAGNLEPVTYSEIFMAKSRGRGNITGAIGIDFFSNIKANYAATRSVFFVFNIFRKIISDQEKDENIFNLLLGYLRAMDKASRENVVGSKIDILSLGFLLKLLDELGYKLEAERCVGCGRRLSLGSNFFSAKSGGILCPDCGKSKDKTIQVSDGAIKLVRIFMKNKIDNFYKIEASKQDVDYLKRIILEELNWVMV
jgi:DNA repair protein RecO (recombination protein O)